MNMLLRFLFIQALTLEVSSLQLHHARPILLETPFCKPMVNTCAVR